MNSNKTVTDELARSGARTVDKVSGNQVEAATADVPAGEFPPDSGIETSAGDIHWLSTQAAARRLGITPRTLYRFIDHGDLPAYRFGRVIRLKAHEVDAFIESSRIKPGELEHLYPEPVGRDDEE